MLGLQKPFAFLMRPILDPTMPLQWLDMLMMGKIRIVISAASFSFKMDKPLSPKVSYRSTIGQLGLSSGIPAHLEQCKMPMSIPPTSYIHHRRPNVPPQGPTWDRFGPTSGHTDLRLSVYVRTAAFFSFRTTTVNERTRIAIGALFVLTGGHLESTKRHLRNFGAV